MKTISQTRWKKCGRFWVRTIVRAHEAGAIRKLWFRNIMASCPEDNPELPPTHS